VNDRTIDQGDGDEQRQAGAQRQNHRTGDATGCSEVADGERKLGPARAARAPRLPGDGGAEPVEHEKYAGNADAIVEGQPTRLGREDGKARQQQRRRQRQADDVRPWQDALGRHLVAKQHASPHLFGAA
jgi:hypothetical protein